MSVRASVATMIFIFMSNSIRTYVTHPNGDWIQKSAEHEIGPEAGPVRAIAGSLLASKSVTKASQD